MRQTRPRRAAKKTAMLEVRVSPDDKQDFLDACRAAGISASVVVRRAMLRQVRIVQERTGRLKMLLTLTLLLPLAGAISPDQATELVPDADVAICDSHAVRQTAIWPIGANGAGLWVPEEGIRIVLRYDRGPSGLAENIEVEAPDGYDAFVTAAVSAVRFRCLPEELPGGRGYRSAFDFRMAPAEGG